METARELALPLPSGVVVVYRPGSRISINRRSPNSNLLLGVTNVVRLEVRGNMLTLFVNNVSILTARDNKFASGNPGIALNLGTATTGYLDDWSGGDLGGIQVSSRSDTLSNASPSATSNHTVAFTTNTNITGSSSITLAFPSGFTVPATLNCGDIDVATSSQFNFNYPDCQGTTTAWGFSVTGTNILLTAPNDTAVHVATGTPITIKIGSNATFQQQGIHWITNPSSAGVYTISVGGTFGGSGNMLVSINSAATVAESLALTASSVNAVNCTADDGATVNSVTSTATSVPFGIISPNAFYQGCQDLVVSTNAGNGYSLTVQESTAMMTAGGNFTIPNTTCDAGNCTLSTATGWTNPVNNGFGHTCTNQTNHDCAATYSCGINFRPTANIANGDAAQTIMSSSTPATAKGRIKFRLSPGSAQPAGTYTTIITYIITGTY